jgi:hypothetical protein
MHKFRPAIICGTILMLWVLSACTSMIETPSSDMNFIETAARQSNPVCDACDQATLVVALTEAKDSADNQAAATAEIVRANAQTTLNSANATLNAAQTQDQNNADVILAQIAGTAAIVRADALATLNSAGSTQSAALTQDAIRQTQIADVATTSAESIIVQQNKDNIAAGTQTAVVNNIATQTQAAAATSQWYSDQERQREEQRKGPIAFLWMLCLAIFIVLAVGLILWRIWRSWMIQQTNQRFLENPNDRLQIPTTIESIPHQHDDPLPNIEGDIIDTSSQSINSEDQVDGWMDEVKRELLRGDKEDEDDQTNN